MAGPVSGKDNVCKEISEAFGLKNCRRLQLLMQMDDVVKIYAECIVEGDDLKKVAYILKGYNLVPADENQQPYLDWEIPEDPEL